MIDATLAGNWIWCHGEDSPRNFYLHVRRSFSLAAEVNYAQIAVTADSRYHLYVNGMRVAHGPARSDRRWQCLDQWDISKYLHAGRNVVGALVHHYGEWTFSYMLGRGGFLADLKVECIDGSAVRIGSDESWRLRPAEAWEQRLPRMSIQLGYPEVFDARKDFEGWRDSTFDDSAWDHALVIGPAGVEPWPRLVPRQIPAMSDVLTFPVRVVDRGWLGDATTGHYIDLLRVIWSTAHAVAYLATYVWAPEEIDVEIHAGSQDALKLWLNTTEIITHFVSRDPAPDQEIIPVRLHAGWNTVLAKVVQGDGQWHFYFRLVGHGSEHCLFSQGISSRPPTSDSIDPWWILGPLTSKGLQEGFDKVFPPESTLDLDARFLGKDGARIGWVSAGVSKEAHLTSVIMSREERIVATGECIRHPDGLINPGSPAEILPGGKQGTYVVIDFGSEVTGFPVLEIEEAEGGEIIDLGYSEALSTPDGDIVSPASGTVGIVNPDRAGVHYADRYICRPGRQQFRTFDKRAFRYMQLDVRNIQRPLKVGPVSLLLSTYPVKYSGSFECSDPVLTRIWEVGRWTIQLNMEDAYTDCPWRERGQWWGDVRIQALVNYYAFGDLRLIKNGIRQIAQSQNQEGWTRGVYPTDWTNAILPTFSLLWIISLRDYHLFSGDRSLLEELLPNVERVLSACQRHRSENGLLRDLPYWLFVDWAEVETRGESASVNALYAGALRAAGEIARAVNRTDVASTYEAMYLEIRQAMQIHLWDSEKNVFRESSASPGMMKVSEQANCWALVFGVVDREKEAPLAKMISRPDWADIKIGTPYFAHYMLQALAGTGRHASMLEYIRAHWKPMLDWGATTWWEQWEPKASFCHGWSSAPTYFLQSEILGVKPLKPGWDEIGIEPHTGDLAWARGKVPTPHGAIEVDWKTSDSLTLSLDVPAKTRVRLPLGERRNVTAVHALDRAPFLPERLPDDQEHATFVIKTPGKYVFRSS